MALLATASFPTLIDVAKRMNPDGSFPDIVELLNLYNPVLQDMPWFEGNLPTGERTTVRTGLPVITNNNFRRLNEGVPLVKSTTAQVDEGAAMLEAFSVIDRKLAIMAPGGAGRYRADESATVLEAMSQFQAANIFYGNAAADMRTFTGLAPRYASKSGVTGKNIVDAGGTGSNNASIWFVAWGAQSIKGIYPKGTKGGFQAQDVTANTASAPDGHPTGDVLFDSAGRRYLGYTEHFEWNCGMSVKDYRYAVRIANIDRAALASGTAAADITRAMIVASNKMPTMSGAVNPVGVLNERQMALRIYMDREVATALDLQTFGKATNTLFNFKEFDTGQITTFRGIPIRIVDALGVAEARVV